MRIIMTPSSYLLAFVAFGLRVGSVDCQTQNTATTTTTKNGTWVQMGKDMDGANTRDFFGTVAMSTDGTTVVIGAPDNDGNGIGPRTGHARVYKWNALNRRWQRRGSDINGNVSLDFFGRATAISANGRMIAIGAPGSKGLQVESNSLNSGSVRILQFNVTSRQWNQMGATIYGECDGDSIGNAVAMSADGSMIVIGSESNTGRCSSISNKFSIGHARVYKLDAINQQWNQMGSDIDGSTNFDRLGAAVAMSTDGLTIALGAPSFSGRGRGTVQVFHFSSELMQWVPVGDAIMDETKDGLGTQVAISADGRIVAVNSRSLSEIGTPNVNVQVFAFSTLNSTWTKIGASIDDIEPISVSLAMSADGSTIACGYTSSYDFAGSVRVYTNRQNTWKQLGPDIVGESFGDSSGYSMALSSDGRTVAIGAPFGNGEGSQRFNSGQVRVFKFQPKTTQCSVSWNLYNSATNRIVAPLVNGTVIPNPPPCNRSNIEAVVQCDNNDTPLKSTTTAVVVLELYNGSGTKLIHRRNERLVTFFLYGNNGNDVYDGRLPAGTYMIRAIVNGTSAGSFTKFTVRGTCI